MIAIAMKPFVEGDFIRACLLKDSEIVCPDKKKHCFANTFLSRNTVRQRVNEITLTDDLTAQLRNKATGCQFYSIAADETIRTTDTAQVMFWVRGVDENLFVTEELA